MTSRRLIIRNIFHFWRQNLAVVAGVATAVAVLSGALIVGESVRASLRDLVLARLGQTDYVVSSDRFFREALAEELQSREGFDSHIVATSPIVYLRGILIHERSGLRTHNVEVYGVDDRFWRFHALPELSGPTGRNVFLGAGLAAELSAAPGDTVLLRLEKQDGVPKESVFGQREDTGRTLRLQCERVLSPGELGEYSLEPSQGQVSAIFVPLARLQRDLDQPASANMILASAADPSDLSDISSDKSAILKESLQASFDLQDIGIRFRRSERGRAVYVESRSVLLDDSIATAAQHSASKARLRSSIVFTYLANSIHLKDRTIPYSVITAADLDQGSFRNVKPLAGKLDQSGTSTIWLTEWAANDLGAELGEEILIDYFMWLPEGRLVTRSAGFTVGGVLALEGELADPFLAPDFPGITEAGSVSDWDPPFPLDLDRIRPADEQFWDDYRTTPKAFVPLSEGQKLWSTRFGKVSSVRLSAEPGVDLDSALAEFELDLRSGLKAEQSGFGVQSVRAERLDASEGSTDFGEYFVYFSFFLISAAVLLAALFFPARSGATSKRNRNPEGHRIQQLSGSESLSGRGLASRFIGKHRRNPRGPRLRMAVALRPEILVGGGGRDPAAVSPPVGHCHGDWCRGGRRSSIVLGCIDPPRFASQLSSSAAGGKPGVAERPDAKNSPAQTDIHCRLGGSFFTFCRRHL